MGGCSFSHLESETKEEEILQVLAVGEQMLLSSSCRIFD